MVQRGPSALPIQPMIGAPIGVPPMKIAMYSAITRPRICGATDSCTVALALVIRVSDGQADRDQGQREQPVGRHQRGDGGEHPEGQGRADHQAQPRALAPGGEQRPGQRADGHDRAEQAVLPGRPCRTAPVAMIAVVIWKFRPNVPTRQTMLMISTRSGRRRT